MKQNCIEKGETQVMEETRTGKQSPHWLYAIKGIFSGASTLLRPSIDFFYRRKKTRPDGFETETIVSYKVN